MAYSASDLPLGDRAAKRALELLPKRARAANRKRFASARLLATEAQP
jgi:hypothetical protein